MKCCDLHLEMIDGKFCLVVHSPEWLVEELIRQLEQGSVFHMQSFSRSDRTGSWVTEYVRIVLEDRRVGAELLGIRV